MGCRPPDRPPTRDASRSGTAESSACARAQSGICRPESSALANWLAEIRSVQEKFESHQSRRRACAPASLKFSTSTLGRESFVVPCPVVDSFSPTVTTAVMLQARSVDGEPPERSLTQLVGKAMTASTTCGTRRSRRDGPSAQSDEPPRYQLTSLLPSPLFFCWFCVSLVSRWRGKSWAFLADKTAALASRRWTLSAPSPKLSRWVGGWVVGVLTCSPGQNLSQRTATAVSKQRQLEGSALGLGVSRV